MTPYTPPYGSIFAVNASSWAGRRIATIDSWGASRIAGYKIESSYSHVLQNLGANVGKFADLSDKGCRIRIPERGEFTGDVYAFREPFVVPMRTQIFNWWKYHEGERYGKFHLFRLWWWYRLAKLFPRINLSRVMLNHSGRVCSTAIDQACKAGGIDLWPELNEDIVGPALLVRSSLLRLDKKDWTTPGV